MDRSDRSNVIAALGRVQSLGGVMAAIGIIIAVIGLVTNKAHFFQGYLFAWVFWMGLTVGCMALTMLHHMIRGRWGIPVLRMWEAGSRNLIVIFILFVPVLLAIFGHALYPWAMDPMPNKAIAASVAKKGIYLNPIFYAGRYVVYFAIWGVLSYILNSSSVRQDRTGDMREREKRAGLGAFGIVCLFITLTFAATDWIMSLEPRWYSTVFPAWLLIGQGMSGITFSTILMVHLRKHEPYREFDSDGQYRDFGNMMLALTMFWGYLSLSQWLIIYSGNLPEEINYYLKRGFGAGAETTVWWVLGTTVMFGQFFAPFVMLLSGKAKRTPALIWKVAAWLLLMRNLDLFWTIMPFFRASDKPVDLGPVWMGLGAWLAIGGIWLFMFVNNIKKYPLIPSHGLLVSEEALEHA